MKPSNPRSLNTGSNACTGRCSRSLYILSAVGEGSRYQIKTVDDRVAIPGASHLGFV
jgi:hypothetical protein